MSALLPIADRLTAVSRARQIPLGAAVEWLDSIPEDAWCFSPELISLHGTHAYATMSEAQKKRLSLFEAVNFFSLNVHGEKALIAGVARRLHGGGYESISPYLHHFLDEENKHMACFAEFCRRYAGQIYRERKFAVARDYTPGEEDFLFFAQALIFEEVVNGYNLRMARDTRLADLLRAINAFHHLEEARHLAFGRSLVLELFARFAPQWPQQTRAAISCHLAHYLESLRSEYFNPDAYRDTGLSDTLALREMALGDSTRSALWREVTLGCRRFLKTNGIIAEEAPP